MKYLLILRHAKSSWKDLNLADHDRPLNKRGKRTAPIMGQRLSIKNHLPEHIISSTAKRALKTAYIVANEINYDENHIETNRNLFHAYPEDMCEVISHCDDSINILMLVAHNPGLTMLANQLLKSIKFENIPTAGLVTIALDINHWNEINNLDSIACHLIDYDYPKLMHNS